MKKINNVFFYIVVIVVILALFSCDNRDEPFSLSGGNAPSGEMSISIYVKDSYPMPVSTIRAMGFDGANLWIIDSEAPYNSYSKEIHVIDLQGNLLKDIETERNFISRRWGGYWEGYGISFKESVPYVVSMNESGTVFTLNSETGESTPSVILSREENWRGLVMGSDYIWVIKVKDVYPHGASEEEVYAFDYDGSFVKSFEIGVNPKDLTIYNGYLYILLADSDETLLAKVGKDGADLGKADAPEASCYGITVVDDLCYIACEQRLYRVDVD